MEITSHCLERFALSSDHVILAVFDCNGDLRAAALIRLLNGKLWLSAQSVDATHALNLSAGVSNSNVLRGRLFN